MSALLRHEFTPGPEADQPHSRPPLERMLRIHQAMQSGGYPNATTLARQLEVSTKSIHRDLEFMRDRLELPIQYDGSRFGYFYTEDVKAFPTLQITEGEIFALVVAEKALQQYRGTSFETAAAQRPPENGAVPARHHFAQPGRRRRRPSPSARAPSRFWTWRSSMRWPKPPPRAGNCELTYRKPGQQQPEQRVVDPYHLANINGEWFLFAFDHLRKDLRTFVPARIKAIRPTGKTFERRPEVLAGKAAARQLRRPVRPGRIRRGHPLQRARRRLHPREEVARLAATARAQAGRGGTAPEALQPGRSRALGAQLGRRCRRRPSRRAGSVGQASCPKSPSLRLVRVEHRFNPPASPAGFSRSR